MSNCCGQDSILQTGTHIGLTEGFVTRQIQIRLAWMGSRFCFWSLVMLVLLIPGPHCEQ